MEDLKYEKESKLRNMVNSSLEHKTYNYLNTDLKSSTSCPDLKNLLLKKKSISTSLPCKLGVCEAKEECSSRMGKTKSTESKNENLVVYKATISNGMRTVNRSIDFNTLNLVISVERWLILFDFFNIVSLNNEEAPVISKCNKDSENNGIKSKLSVSVKSFNLLLIRSEEEFCKVVMSKASFKLKKEVVVQEIEGRLGTLAIYDLTRFGYLYREKFTTVGPEALGFLYKRKKIISDLESEDCNLAIEATIHVRMASIKYIHTKRFLMQIISFVQDLVQLKSPVLRKIKSNDQRTISTKKPLRLGLEINTKSSTILFPLSNQSQISLIADLGEFQLSNGFQYTNYKGSTANKTDLPINEILDVMKITVDNINMFVGTIIDKPNECYGSKYYKQYNFENFHVVKLGNNFLKDACCLNFQIERKTYTNTSDGVPDIKTIGTLSKISAVINLSQYKSIKEFLYYNLGETIDDIYYNSALQNQNSKEFLNEKDKKSHKEKNMNVWNTLSINFRLENVSILLDNETNYKSEISPFACIDFIKSSLEINSFSDSSQDISLISKEISILDAHENSQNHPSNQNFKFILHTTGKNCSKNLAQLEIHFRKTFSISKFVILLNNMRVMALSDCLKSLKNYFTVDPNVNLTNSAVQKFKNEETLVTEEKQFIEIVLNVNDSDLVFVEKCDQKDVNAIILKTNTVISHKPKNYSNPMSLDINYLEVFSCILGSEDQTALSIIDPFKLKMEIQNNCLEVLIHNALNIRLSYNDVKLIKSIFQVIPNQKSKNLQVTSENTFDFEVIAPLIAMGFSQSDCWYAMELNNYKLNDAAIWLSQQKDQKVGHAMPEIHKVTINAYCISICVIDDCMDADVPLLELSLSNLKLTQKIKEKVRDDINFYIPNLEGHLEATVASDYYNRHLSGWEPVTEPWECSADWKYSKKNSSTNNTCDISISSKYILKVNITSNLIDLYDIVRKNWTEDYFCTKINKNPLENISNVKRRSPFIPFALENLTGEPLLFKTIYSQPGGITRTEVNQQDMMCDWISVHHNQIVQFDFGPQTKLRHMDSHKLNQHQIFVQIHGWTLIGPISIDKVGVFFRYSNLDLQYKKKTRVVFKISLIGSAQKLITVKSALNIINKLDTQISLKMEIKNQDKVSELLLNPNDILSVPLRFLDSLIYIKPTLNAYKSNIECYLNDNVDNNIVTDGKAEEQIEYCTVGIMWNNCKDDNIQQLFCCYAQTKKVFYSLVEIQRDSYPIRENSMPGHTISILAPLRIKNMLCCDLLFEISNSIHGRIESSSIINVHSVNITESFQMSITLDNFKLSGQINIPVGHTGIVEPKVKLIDIANRELYLRVSIQSIKGSGMEICVSAPVWIMNRTGLPLIFKQEGLSHLAAGQFEEHESARMVTPLLFSFSDQEGSPSLEMRLGKRFGENNPWCKGINIHKEIIFRELKANNLNSCYSIGIHTFKGLGFNSVTNFVTVSPRYKIFNRTSYKLELAQKCDIQSNERVSMENIISALPGCNFPLHWANCDQEPIICVRNADVEFCCWSSGLSVNNEQSFFINMRNDLAEMFFLRLQIILNNATFNLLFSEPQSLPPPFRIDNFSKVIINFSQVGCSPCWRTIVRPQSSLAYVLDDPLGEKKIHLEAPGGNSIEFSLKEFGTSQSLTYSNFLYIAFKKTFKNDKPNNDSNSSNVDYKELVLGVRDKRVYLMKKCTGDRSQLWLMNSSGQLEHEGSSPPIEIGKTLKNNSHRMVLDLEKALNPREYTRLVIRPPNKQRITTQSWKFENGRLLCHANMCVQANNGVYGLHAGIEAVLGHVSASSNSSDDNEVPVEENIEIQKLRLGSGHLNVTSKMDGPIHAIIIQDVIVNKNDTLLSADQSWKHASLIAKKSLVSGKSSFLDDFSIFVELKKGLGLSIVSAQPCEELLYITLENIILNMASTSTMQTIDLKVCDVQIDNQLLNSPCPVLLHVPKIADEGHTENALAFSTKLLPSPNKNAVIFEFMTLIIKPCVVILEERLILKTAQFLRFGELASIGKNTIANDELQASKIDLLSSNIKRYFFENFYIAKTEVRLSLITAQKLCHSLMETKKELGLSFIKFEDALIEFESFSDQHHFETLNVYLKAIKAHYKNQLKWHAGSILGSVDFLGNPLGFANDLSEGVSGLIFEGSVKSLFRNVTHGISNSTAKLTETLSDSLGKVVLDDFDKETRQNILETQTKSSGSHLAAGFKGLGFGLLGGVTSIVRNSYVGAQSDGFPGFISGFGKGLVGTVTKPLIGVLDLAAETACAVRESSKSSNRILPDRRRLPRCVTGAPGGLLPEYSHRQSKGQQYLYYINNRNFSEKLISYEPNLCNDKEAKLRLLVSTEYIRIFSRCDDHPTLMLECHLSEVLSCHPLTTNVFISDLVNKGQPSYYIEISTNSPKITRPRVRCQNEEVAERASRHINYAKSIYDEREQSIVHM